MKKEIRIKMAEREGWTHKIVTEHNVYPYGDNMDFTLWTSPTGSHHYGTSGFPTYDNDNDLDRYIRGMDKKTLSEYMHHLNGGYGIHDATDARGLLIKSPEQKLEAIIKAEGWK